AGADVARIAAAVDLLVEVAEDHRVPAAVLLELVVERDGGAPARVAHGAVRYGVEESLVQLRIGPRVEQPAVGGQAVAARATDLLIPGLDVLRHVAMHDVAHVRLVDAHAERDRRDDDVDVIARERVLVARTLCVRQARVIRHGAHALRAQELARLLDTLARHAVDDAALALVRTHQRQHLRARVAALSLLAHADAQVRPEERALVAGRLY